MAKFDERGPQHEPGVTAVPPRPDLIDWSAPPPPPGALRTGSPGRFQADAGREAERNGTPDAGALEDRIVGTWFARVGALAVVAGAGFGVAYAVRRGWIGPVGRALGIAALGGIALVVSERARRRGWNAPAQAIAASSIGLLYLAAWSSARVDGLIPLPAALVLLTAVAALGAGLAVRHDSQPLAMLALAAGLLNPFTTGALHGPGTLADVVVVAGGALTLAWWRGWHLLERATVAGAWLVAFTTGPAGEPGELVWAGVLFGTFAVHPLLEDPPERPPRHGDLGPVAAVANGFAFLLFLETALTPRLAAWRGASAFAIAGAYAGLWAVAARRRRTVDSGAARVFQGLTFAMIAAGLAIQLGGVALGSAWSVEGVLLLWLGRRRIEPDLRAGGLALVGLGFLRTIVVEFALGAAYEPAKLVLSRQSLAVGVQVAALAMAARLLRTGAARWERAARSAAIVAANAVALGWATLEVRAEAVRASEPGRSREQAVAFAVSAVWAMYAAGAYAAGIVVRSRRVRLAAAGLFGLTVLKMVLSDAQLLGAGLRMVVFVGVGVLLIVCSLAYHRFRSLLGARPDR